MKDRATARARPSKSGVGVEDAGGRHALGSPDVRYAGEGITMRIGHLGMNVWRFDKDQNILLFLTRYLAMR